MQKVKKFLEDILAVGFILLSLGAIVAMVVYGFFQLVEDGIEESETVAHEIASGEEHVSKYPDK